MCIREDDVSDYRLDILSLQFRRKKEIEPGNFGVCETFSVEWDVKVVEGWLYQIKRLEGFEVGFDRLEEGIEPGPILVDDASVGTVAAKMGYRWHKGELERKGVEME
jgi:hypothetical protein